MAAPFGAGAMLVLAIAGSRADRMPAYPLPASPVRALPSLESSDVAVRTALEKVEGGKELLPLLVPNELVRCFVAGVHEAVRPSAGKDVARGAGRVPGTADFARHEPYVRALERLHLEGVVGVYVRLYPLFQQAYRDHVGEGRHFNDALVAAIDHVLRDPPPGHPPVTAGQRLMARLAPGQAGRVRIVLLALRGRLALHAAGG